MKSLVTRFHLLFLTVTVAITGVAILRVPEDYIYPAHWSGSTADWAWPRDLALIGAPLVEVVLIVAFFILGNLLTKNHYAKVQHILDPALSLLLAVPTAVQLGFLLTGSGSDIDVVRIAGAGLGAALLVLGAVLFDAQRNTYAGLRMPWPIRSDTSWRAVHRVTGLCSALAGAGLLGLAWFDPGFGLLIISYAATLLALPILAGLTSYLTRSL